MVVPSSDTKKNCIKGNLLDPSRELHYVGSGSGLRRPGEAYRTNACENETARSFGRLIRLPNAPYNCNIRWLCPGCTNTYNGHSPSPREIPSYSKHSRLLVRPRPSHGKHRRKDKKMLAATAADVAVMAASVGISGP